MGMQRRTALAVVLAVASACNRAPAGPPAGQAMPPTPVALAVAQAAPIEDSSEYVASLKSLRSTTVQPQIDGQITKILVAAGARVSQGAPLMEIDARRQQAAVSSQQAELAAAEAAVSYARQQQQRNSELLTAGAISKAQAEQTDTALRTADSNLKALQAQVQQQEVQLRFFTITAPTAGVVRRAGARRQSGDAADAADDDRSERHARGERVGAGRTRAGAQGRAAVAGV